MNDPIDDLADKHQTEIESLPKDRSESLRSFMIVATGAFSKMHPDDVKTAIRMLREADECPEAPTATGNN